MTAPTTARWRADGRRGQHPCSPRRPSSRPSRSAAARAPRPTGSSRCCKPSPLPTRISPKISPATSAKKWARSPAPLGNGGSTITQTIVVPPNTIYDGGGEVLTADPTAMNCDLTEGEQAESQRPYFLLAPGASLRNVTINYLGCEGVHMMGDNILDNITWVDVAKTPPPSAATFRAAPSPS